MSDSKKLVPVDGTSVEEAAETLGLIRVLVESGQFSPVGRVAQELGADPIAWVGRALVPVFVSGFLGILLAGGLGPSWSPKWVSYAWFLGLTTVLPIWSVSGVGVWSDRLAGREPGSIPDQLLRWKGSLSRALVLAAMGWAGFFGGLALLNYASRIGVPESALFVYGLLGTLWISLVWGWAACALVIRRRGILAAGVAGAGTGLRQIIELPGLWLRWMRQPDLRSLQSGRKMVVPYLAGVWVLTILGLAFGCMAGALAAIPMGLLLPTKVRTVIWTFGALGTAMGFEAGVGLGSVNFLAVMAEELPALPPAHADVDADDAEGSEERERGHADGDHHDHGSGQV